MNKLLLVLLICLFYLCGLPKHTSAAGTEGTSLGVYPPILQIQAQIPASIKTPITIYNYSPKEVTVDILFKPFTSSKQNNGTVSLLDDKQTDKLPNSLRITDNDNQVSQLILSPKQVKKLNLEIEIAKDALSQDYNFSIVFMGNKQPEEKNKNFALTLGGIATNVLLSVGNNVQPVAVIEDYSVPMFLQSGPVPFVLKVRNSGIHYMAPKGHIIIKNIFNQTIGNVDLQPVNILANSSRFIPAVEQATVTNKTVNLNQNENPRIYWNNGFLLGPYWASLTYTLSDTGPTFNKTDIFIAIPIYSVVILLIIVGILFFTRKRILLYIRSKSKTG